MPGGAFVFSFDRLYLFFGTIGLRLPQSAPSQTAVPLVVRVFLRPPSVCVVVLRMVYLVSLTASSSPHGGGKAAAP